MNDKMLKRLAGALIALIVLWAGIGLVRRSGRDVETHFALPHVDAKSVDHASILHLKDTLRFDRKGADWFVNGARADAKLVEDMLKSFADSSIRSELVAQSASSHQRLGLDSANAHRVIVREGEKVLADLLVGSRGSGYGTVFVRRPGDNAAYELSGALADVADRLPDDWRDKSIAKVESDSVVTIEVQRGKTSFRLSRSDKGWTVGNGPADSVAVAGLLDRFRTLSASGFATSAQMDSAKFNPADRVVKLTGRGDRVLLVLSADSTTGGYWVRREGDSTVFRMNTWDVDQIAPLEKTLKKK